MKTSWQKSQAISRGFPIVLIGILVLNAGSAVLQETQRKAQRSRPERPPTLGLEQGLLKFETPDFLLRLVKASQTVAALQPIGASGFDFTPADRLDSRASDGFHHLGDVILRTRLGDSGEWKSYSTATARKPVSALLPPPQSIAAADLTPTLPSDCPIQITRTWALEEGKLILRFDLKNTNSQQVHLGGLGIPMIFNNILTRRSLEEAHEICSFSDPYIGQDAGYLQVTRLSGLGPALVVIPEGKTPFEAFRTLSEPMPPRQTFEGSFEWIVHSRAYADSEWKDADPWNPPTMAILAPGETKTYGVRILLAPSIRDIEKTLAENSRPVALGIPGYILPGDQKGRLFLHSTSPVASVKSEPEGSLEIDELPPTRNGWLAYAVTGKGWGRARLTIAYQSGLVQTIHYYLTKPAARVASDLGNFLFTKQWFEDPDDPFHRSPSVISYDREADSIVLQDGRVWIAGLGDEGGSGSWVAAAMKEFGLPKRKELAQYEQFVNNVLWGGIQYAEGERKYGVRKSMLFYAPEEFPEGFYHSDIDWSTWTSWDREGAEAVNRSYNYPHAAAAYWVMYRLARNNDGLVISQPWEWFLERAFHTARVMPTFARGHARHGQMEGTVFLEILLDLKREGWTEQAAMLEEVMAKRADRWKDVAYPFGSEMAWDSTGQEEVYAWCKYFGYEDKALVSLNSVIGYMPTVPHWGYNGNARRYWDFLYGGKLRRIERQLHHYGSGLNAIPVLSEYRAHPEDFYLLRIGYGGMMGALSNIDQEGFASAAFHSFPTALHWDPYSGDYGPNFFGHAMNTGVYVIDHPEFGWQAFGGNVTAEDAVIKVDALDTFRKRIYVAPYGLWLTLDAGMFDAIEIDTSNRTLRLGLSPGDPHTPYARLRIEQPAPVENIITIASPLSIEIERGAYVVPLDRKITWLELGVGP